MATASPTSLRTSMGLLLLGLLGPVPGQTNWTRIRTSPFPAYRKEHSVVYDAARKRVILFGGTKASGVTDEMWEWNGIRWSQLRPTTRPSPRSNAAIAYDSHRARVVLFGGIGKSGCLRDTWEWDGKTWTQVATSGPPRSHGAGMAYDAHHRVIVLHGGIDTSGPIVVHTSTWEWNGQTWVDRSPAKRPPPRYAGFGIAYDEVRRVVVLFGGFDRRTYPNPKPYGDTWLWDGRDWTQQNPKSSPSPRGTLQMAYDSARDRVVLFGGNTGNSIATGETWEWDGATWIQRSPAQSPPAREAHAVVYDSERRQVVVFGGKRHGTNEYSDTWLYAPTHPGSVESIGPGCLGSNGVPVLDGKPGPWIGSTLELRASKLPRLQACLFFVGRGKTPPLDLAFLNAPGCKLRVRIAFALAFPTGNGNISLPLRVADDRGLIGLRLYTQVYASDPNAVSRDAVVSNGVEITVGAK